MNAIAYPNINAKSNLQHDNQFVIAELLHAEIIASSDGTPYRNHLYAADISSRVCPVLLWGRSPRVAFPQIPRHFS